MCSAALKVPHNRKAWSSLPTGACRALPSRKSHKAAGKAGRTGDFGTLITCDLELCCLFKASTLQLELKSILLLLLDYDATVNEGDVCATRDVVDMSHVLTCVFPPMYVPGQ